MAEPTIIHVHPYGNLWKIQVAVEHNYHSVYRSRAEAAEAAFELAKSRAPSRVIVHREDGTIEKELSYGNYGDQST